MTTSDPPSSEALPMSEEEEESPVIVVAENVAIVEGSDRRQEEGSSPMASAATGEDASLPVATASPSAGRVEDDTIPMFDMIQRGPQSLSMVERNDPVPIALGEEDDDSDSIAFSLDAIETLSNMMERGPQSQSMAERNHDVPTAPGEEAEEDDNDSFALALDDIEALSNQVAISTVIHDMEAMTHRMDMNTLEDISRLQDTMSAQAQQVEEIRTQRMLHEARQLRQNSWGCDCCPIGLL